MKMKGEEESETYLMSELSLGSAVREMRSNVSTGPNVSASLNVFATPVSIHTVCHLCVHVQGPCGSCSSCAEEEEPLVPWEGNPWM